MIVRWLSMLLDSFRHQTVGCLACAIARQKESDSIPPKRKTQSTPANQFMTDVGRSEGKRPGAG